MYVDECSMTGRWGGRRDLNPRLSVPQTDALPAELLPPPVEGLVYATLARWKSSAEIGAQDIRGARPRVEQEDAGSRDDQRFP